MREFQSPARLTQSCTAASNYSSALSLYIHLPWCVKKCPYCDFNSHEIKDAALAEKAYTDALLLDLEFEFSRISERQISSIFIGGGTPSLFSAESLDRILCRLRSEFNLQAELEITLEANPGTAEAEKFQAYRDIGINRLSIGVQSFDTAKLSKLGRIHDADEALAAIQMAKDSGFENFNIDLMFGLPEQQIDDALTDLEIACAQGATHISWYQLTLEPNTLFYKQVPVLPKDEVIWRMQTQGQQILASNAYAQYEISAYAKAGRQCKHNLNYWKFGDYLGIGAGAHGKLSNMADGRIKRFARHRIPESYMRLAGRSTVIVDEKFLQENDIILEFMMNAFRLHDGFNAILFSARSGLAMGKIQPMLDIAVARGLIQQDEVEIRTTAMGRNYLNNLLEIFMQDQA